MNRSTLFVITSDPKRSHRPAEAIRIAAGVGAWKKVEVNVFLAGAATQILGEPDEAWIDGENFDRYLPLIAESGRPFHVETNSQWLPDAKDLRFSISEIDWRELSRLLLNSEVLLRF